MVRACAVSPPVFPITLKLLSADTVHNRYFCPDRFGTLNVVELLPLPYVVDIRANRAAYIVREYADPSHKKRAYRCNGSSKLMNNARRYQVSSCNGKRTRNNNIFPHLD